MKFSLASLKSGLNSIFQMAATIFEPSYVPTEFRNSVIGYETNDMNDFARKHHLPIHVRVDRPKTGETNAIFLTIHVHQGHHAYPSERKIAKSIDLTNDETIQEGLGNAKALFFAECKRMNPAAVPTQSVDFK